jgi:hypothetical protein
MTSTSFELTLSFKRETENFSFPPSLLPQGLWLDFSMRSTWVRFRRGKYLHADAWVNVSFKVGHE